METNLHRSESVHGSVLLQLGETMKAVSVARWLRMGLLTIIVIMLGIFYLSLFSGGDMLSSLLSFERSLVLFAAISLGIDMGTQINLGIKEIRISREFVQLSQHSQRTQHSQSSQSFQSFQQSPQHQQYQRPNNMVLQADEFSKMARFLKAGAIVELVDHGIIALMGTIYVSLIFININSGYGALILLIFAAILVIILEIIGKILHVITWMKFSSWFNSTVNEAQHREAEFKGAKPKADTLKIGYIVHAGGYVAIIGLYYISWLIIIIGNIIFTVALATLGKFLQTSGNVLGDDGNFHSSPRNVPQVDSFAKPQQTPPTYKMDTGMNASMDVREKFCTFCGADFGGDNLRFCPNCGHVIKD
ncbi:MAG: hypothetical protein ACTSVZ_09900 [Promethearchaeota archaeon]